MSIVNARKYDPSLTLDKQLEASMTPDQLKRWNDPLEAQKRTPHGRGGCMATESFKADDAKLKAGELGPGTIWSCDDCGAQKMVVHLGLPQETETLTTDGKRQIVQLPPLGWRNLSQGSR